MSRGQGFTVLQQLLFLKGTPAQVGVLPIHWKKFLSAFPADRPPRLLSEFAREAKRDSGVAQTETEHSNRGTDFGGQLDPFGALNASNIIRPNNKIDCQIAEEWQRLLGVTSVSTHDNFLDLGGNSILAVRFLAWIFEMYQIEISVSDFFQAPTVAAVAALLTSLSDRPLDSATDRIERVNPDVSDTFSAQLGDLTENQMEEMVRKLSVDVGEERDIAFARVL